MKPALYPKTRILDGNRFTLEGFHFSKVAAQDSARELRRKGYRARLIKLGYTKWAVYKRGRWLSWK